MNAAPTWVITPYQAPALRAASRRLWSTRTRASDERAMISQRNMNVATLPAAGTSIRTVMKTAKPLAAFRPFIPWDAYPIQ